MPSTKKPASSKRAAFPREASYEKRFVKDWERLSRSGRYNMKQLKEAMMMARSGPRVKVIRKTRSSPPIQAEALPRSISPSKCSWWIFFGHDWI